MSRWFKARHHRRGLPTALLAVRGWVLRLRSVFPSSLTLESVPTRLTSNGNPWQAMNEAPQSLEPLLALHQKDMEAGLMDAPWPPVYPKQPNEPDRVAPSRARH
jgi:hypothetical protein